MSSPPAASPTPPAPFALVVTADDFGIGEATSRGIIDSHLRGPVTASSLMVVTGEHVLRSIPLLEKAPTLDVGLHVVLTRCGHKPLVATAASGLVDRDGQFFTNGQLWQRAFLGRLEAKGLFEEIAAQAERFRSLLGRMPDYVDAHHHAHELPTVRQALVAVIAAGRLPAITRVTIEPPGMLRQVGGVRAKRLAATLLGRQAAIEFAAGRVWTNDSYFGMLTAADLAAPFPWTRHLAVLPQTGVVEWVVHPGQADETLAGRDEYRSGRVAEWQAFTSPGTSWNWEALRPFLARKSVLARG